MTALNSHAQVLAADAHEPKAHASTHESGGSDEIDVTGLTGAASPTEITDIPTAEMDDTLVLAPDGAGGVEFRAEAGGSGVLTLFDDQLLASAAAAFDFTSIPGTARHLRLVVQARSAYGSTEDQIWLRINNDSGSNYDWEYMQDAGSSSGGATPNIDESLATSNIPLTNIPASSFPAGSAGQCVVDLANYAEATFHKTVRSAGFAPLNTSSGSLRLWFVGGRWRNTAAITRLTLVSKNGANFAAGSRATLYLVG